MNEPIRKEDILSSLKGRLFGSVVYAFEEIDSTNCFAKRLALKGKPEGTIIYAEKQTQGRGRWGRFWDSPKGKGLWFSVIFRPSLNPSSASLLTLLGATSLVWSVERSLGFRLELRWPNDILFNGKKLAGVLTETSGGQKTMSYAVLGIGVNVNQGIEDFSPDVREKAISLRMAIGNYVGRLSLLTIILSQLEKDYLDAQTIGFDFILRRWISRSSILGREVLLQVNSHTMKGVVRGFHGNGDLILAFPDGKERRYSEGDIIEVNHVVGRGCR